MNTEQGWVPGMPNSIQTMIYESLKKDSPKAAETFAVRCQSELDATTEASQIENLNQYWNLTLAMSLTRDVTNERSALVSGVSAKDWMVNFDQYIKPLVIEIWG